VADLLGFRDPARNETPSGSFRRNFLLDREIPDAAAEAGMAAMANTAPLAVPGVARLAGTIDSGSGWPTPTGSNRVPTPPPYPSPVGLIRPTGLSPAATGGAGALTLRVVRAGAVLGSARAGVRVGSAMVLLGLVVVGSVLAYQRIPWLHGESAPVVTAPTRPPVAAAPSAPSEQSLRAARLRELSAQVEALLRRPSIGSGDVPAVQELAARLTSEKELAAAEKLRADAASKLATQAVVGAQTGKLDDAPRTFAAAVALDVKTPSAGFVRALAQRGEALMGAGQSAEAARWAREALRWNPADVDARALLGSALLAAGDFSGALPEIQTAVSARPGDPSLRRLLVRARAHRPQPPIGAIEASPSPRPRRRAAARPAAASGSPATLNPGDDILPGENLPSAPRQPTPQKE
jgi:Tetratricopeptide repeat